MKRVVTVTIVEETINACNKIFFESPQRNRQLESPRYCR